MTRTQLEASLKLWDERKHRFYRNWRRYVSKHSTSPRRAYWYAQYKAASKIVARRKGQLATVKVSGVSPEGVALVKRFEGFRSKPYRDAVGVWTIGYGETKGIGPNTKPVTEAQAAAQLQRRLDRDYFPAVRALPTFAKLSQAQVDALTSFVYNVGPGGIAPTTSVGRALRTGRFHDAADGLLAWNKAGGRVLPGLTTRRQAERKLFLS